MSVSKKNRRKIVVDDQEFCWNVKGMRREEYDDSQGVIPLLSVLSVDKKMRISYPLSQGLHSQFMRRLANAQLTPPTPQRDDSSPPDDSLWHYLFIPVFIVTPFFVRDLIDWAIANNVSEFVLSEADWMQARINFLVSSHGGLDQEICSWRNCENLRLKGIAYCAECVIRGFDD